MLARIVAAGVIVLAHGAVAEPVFTKVSEDLGLTQSYDGGWEFFVGGGVASFDCDGDQFADLFLAGGAGPSTLLRNRTGTRGGALKLVADTPANLRLDNVIGAYPLDVDSDGILDLFVLRLGENTLLKGGKDCTFSKFSDLDITTGDHWSTAFSATWEGQNRLPTLAIGNYVDRDNPDGPFEACDTNYLLRPVQGKYEKSELNPGFCPLSMLFSDWGRTARQDLRLSNDRHYYVRAGSEQMWSMEDTPRLFNERDGWKDYKLWGMGIASRDITGDGYPEVFLSSMGDQKLQTLDRAQTGPVFRDATYERGTTAQRPYTGDDGRPSTGWQVEFGDVDNDGRDDVFIAKGNVDQMPDAAMADPNNLLMQMDNGSFVEYGLEAGIASTERGRGAALVDLNLDGRLDLVVVNRRAPVEIYQNETSNTGNWLLLDVRHGGANSRLVGGWVELTDGTDTWTREITVGGGHASGNAGLMHFGLGQSSALRLRVIAPDGTPSGWQEVRPNQIVRLTLDGGKLAISHL